MDSDNNAGEHVTPETRICTNCRKDIAVTVFQLHELHCMRRQMTVCNKCGACVPESDLEEHDEQNHSQVLCDLCNKSMEESELEDHKANDCRRRPVLCPFCDLNYPLCDFVEHESACGSRTDQCDRCLKIVMLKFMARHQGAECRGFATDQAGPSNATPRDARFSVHPPARPHLLPKISNMEANKPSSRSRPSRGKGPVSSLARIPKQQASTRGLGGATRPVEPRENLESDDEDTLLPCEFCEVPMRVEDLIVHQSVCDGGRGFDHSGFHTRPAEPPSSEPLSEMRPVHHHSRDGTRDDSHRRWPREDDVHRSFDEDTLLPCEFCQVPMSMEDLMVHQAVCDGGQAFDYSRLGSRPADLPSHEPLSETSPLHQRSWVDTRDDSHRRQHREDDYNQTFRETDRLHQPQPFTPQNMLTDRRQGDTDEEYVQCAHCDFPISILELFDHEMACRIEQFGTVYGPIDGLNLSRPTEPPPSGYVEAEGLQSLSLDDHALRDTRNIHDDQQFGEQYGQQHPTSQREPDYGDRDTLRTPGSPDAFGRTAFQNRVTDPNSSRGREPSPLRGRDPSPPHGRDVSPLQGHNQCPPGGRDLRPPRARDPSPSQRRHSRLSSSHSFDQPPGESLRPYLDDISSNPFGPEDGGEEMVSCEFCDSEYPISGLMLHEAVCADNPDYSSHRHLDRSQSTRNHEYSGYSHEDRVHGGSFGRHLDSHSRRHFREGMSDRAETGRCGFCGVDYPCDILVPHQEVCLKNPVCTEVAPRFPTDEALMGYSSITSKARSDVFQRPAVRDRLAQTSSTRTSSRTSPNKASPGKASSNKTSPIKTSTHGRATSHVSTHSSSAARTTARSPKKTEEQSWRRRSNLSGDPKESKMSNLTSSSYSSKQPVPSDKPHGYIADGATSSSHRTSLGRRSPAGHVNTRGSTFRRHASETNPRAETRSVRSYQSSSPSHYVAGTKPLSSLQSPGSVSSFSSSQSRSRLSPHTTSQRSRGLEVASVASPSRFYRK